MRVAVIGAGWYGCHIALTLKQLGHEVCLQDDRGIFSGASGNNPARLHQGFHYPRSERTRAACAAHEAEFLRRYGRFTRAVPCNIYAVARDSLVDFGTYCKAMLEEQFVRIDPKAYGLEECEGAVLTAERHIVCSEAREFFVKEFADLPRDMEDPDWTVDCTYGALGAVSGDRFEPCITVLLHGPTDRAVTVMDGPLPGVYPWDESKGLSSLSSAKYTPLGRYSSYAEARAVLEQTTQDALERRCCEMFEQMRVYWPEIAEYRIAGHKLAVRCLPASAADARLVDVAVTGRTVRVRAGKIDAIFEAERKVLEVLC